MNTMRIIWGLISEMMLTDSPKVPRLCLQYPKMIPITKSIGVYGILVFLLIYLRIVAKRSPRNTKRTAWGPL
jgi:hypothetical protein